MADIPYPTMYSINSTYQTPIIDTPNDILNCNEQNLNLSEPIHFKSVSCSSIAAVIIAYSITWTIGIVFIILGVLDMEKHLPKLVFACMFMLSSLFVLFCVPLKSNLTIDPRNN